MYSRNHQQKVYRRFRFCALGSGSVFVPYSLEYSLFILKCMEIAESDSHQELSLCCKYLSLFSDHYMTMRSNKRITQIKARDMEQKRTFFSFLDVTHPTLRFGARLIGETVSGVGEA